MVCCTLLPVRVALRTASTLLLPIPHCMATRSVALFMAVSSQALLSSSLKLANIHCTRVATEKHIHTH